MAFDTAMLPAVALCCLVINSHLEKKTQKNTLVLKMKGNIYYEPVSLRMLAYIMETKRSTPLIVLFAG